MHISLGRSGSGLRLTKILGRVTHIQTENALRCGYPHPPHVVPPGGGVTWCTQNFSLRLTVLLCG